MRRKPDQSLDADDIQKPTALPSDAARSCKEAVRSAPLQAIFSAALVGFVLQLLPLGRIAAVLCRILLALAKPAILTFGAVKLFSWLARQAKNPEPRHKTS